MLDEGRGRWLVAVIAVAWLVTLLWWPIDGEHAIMSDPQGGDFYPVYVGVSAILDGIGPYHPSVNEALEAEWEVGQTHDVACTVAYPLPGLLPLVPFALLPVRAASLLWFALSVGLVAAGVFQRRSQWVFLLYPLMFHPLYKVGAVLNSTMLWFGLVALAVFGRRRLPAPVLGPILAMMLFKPQLGALFALWVLAECLFHRREVILWAIGWTVVLVGASFVTDPGWPAAWLESVAIYRRDAVLVSLWPGAVFFLLPTLGLPRYVFLSMFCAVFFPVGALYNALPLLIAWHAFVPRVVVPALALSWLAPLLISPVNQMSSYLLFSVGPLWVACMIALVQLRLRGESPLLLGEAIDEAA